MPNEVKVCAHCQKKPQLTEDKQAWALMCECGRGSASVLSYEDALERWNAQADNADIAAMSAYWFRRGLRI